MKGQFSESTFTKRRYSGVLMQQGRVRLDADWNEKLDVCVDEDTVRLDVWEREVRTARDDSLGGAAVGEAETDARGTKKSEEWCLRLTREVVKTGSSSFSVKFALGRVGPGLGRALVIPESEVSVDGVPWTSVGSFSGAGPNDKVYVVRRDPNRGGASYVEFGDGTKGAKPPTGARVTVDYRFGGGIGGNSPRRMANRAERTTGKSRTSTGVG